MRGKNRNGARPEKASDKPETFFGIIRLRETPSTA
jgi:hypothetical protein